MTDTSDTFHWMIYPNGIHLHLWHRLLINGQLIDQVPLLLLLLKLRPLCWPSGVIQIISQNMAHKTLKIRHLLKLFSFMHGVYMRISAFFSLRYYSIAAACRHKRYPEIVNTYKAVFVQSGLNSHHVELLRKECFDISHS